MNVEELANNLARYRNEAGMTQQGLANKVGVSRKTINTIENSVFVPSTVLALKLSRALGQPVEALFRLIDQES